MSSRINPKANRSLQRVQVQRVCECQTFLNSVPGFAWATEELEAGAADPDIGEHPRYGADLFCVETLVETAQDPIRTASKTGAERTAHFQNFLEAVKRRDPKLLCAEVLEGHLS